MKRILKNILIVTCGIYGLGFTIFTPYFNWKYAREHGLIKWIYFGEIVATAKGVAWPFFIINMPNNTQSPLNQEDINSINHAFKAIEYKNIALKIIDDALLNKIAQDNPNELIAQIFEMEEAVKYMENSLKEANLVNIKSLNLLYHGLGDHFLLEFTKGIKLFMNSVKTKNSKVYIDSDYYLQLWSSWYSVNRNNIPTYINITGANFGSE